MTYQGMADNVTSGVSFFQWLNLSVEYLFIPIILMALYFIILIKTFFSSGMFSRSFAAASFIVMLASVLFRVLDLVSTSFMVIFIILTGISVIMLRFENSGGVA